MAFGISGVAISSAITKYRILFLIIAFSLLALAFYIAYKPSKSRTECKQESCTPNRIGTFNYKTLNRVLLWIVAAFTIAFAFLPKYIHLFSFNQSETETEQPCCPAAAIGNEKPSTIADSDKKVQKNKNCNPSKNK